ncbi:KAP family P-loop NTPase fold protein [Butyrivibrio fibrisolvens]|uniref:KAP family P-loop NTPase fold protein n=1 Tax=Butyrivibrio fibrisolvens TaxID=831 RepID=UPI0003B5E092|nr:P-loop NTPase fold protein [Butyrivibrio fibrisolvens]
MGRMTGITDEAAVKDDFSIDRYKKGLCDFIVKCDTPMTVAIQGDWGSGKTSMMQMVRNDLPDTVKSVWFNTWQYSQFNLDKELTISFMKDIVNELDVKDEQIKSAFNSSVKKVGGVLKTGLSMFVDNKIGGKTSEVLEQIIDVLSGARGENDAVSEIKVLRNNFESCVKKALDENGKNRLIVFVDDLDRLNPGKAVELLEVLKIFLDCKDCVFVLAIDYAVVTRGVKEKYGEDFDEEKGRSFFDKIIQVPFKMPVAQYDIKKYVSNRLKDIGIGYSTIEELQKMTNLIQSSIGNNPRSMKRLFNSYLLLSSVIEDSILKEEKSKQLMFAILCMQSRYEAAYNYLARHQELITAEYLNKLTSDDSEELKHINLKEKDQASFANFAVSLNELIDRDGHDGIDADELKAFKEALRYSTITSTSDDEEPGEERWNIRYVHKDLCIEFADRLNKKYNVSFSDHFYKGKNIGCWRINCWSPEKHKDKNGKNLRIEYQAKLAPTEYEGKSTLQIDIQYTWTPEVDVNYFFEQLGNDPLSDTSRADATYKVEKYDIGYEYQNVTIFDPYSEKERVYSVIESSFMRVLEYFR